MFNQEYFNQKYYGSCYEPYTPCTPPNKPSAFPDTPKTPPPGHRKKGKTPQECVLKSSPQELGTVIPFITCNTLPKNQKSNVPGTLWSTVQPQMHLQMLEESPPAMKTWSLPNMSLSQISDRPSAYPDTPKIKPFVPKKKCVVPADQDALNTALVPKVTCVRLSPQELSQPMPQHQPTWGPIAPPPIPMTAVLKSTMREVVKEMKVSTKASMATPKDVPSAYPDSPKIKTPPPKKGRCVSYSSENVVTRNFTSGGLIPSATCRTLDKNKLLPVSQVKTTSNPGQYIVVGN